MATWWSVAMGGGIALGPIVTGLLDLAGAWRAFYAVLAAAGLVMWLVTGRLPGHLHASRRHAPRLDVVGFVLVTAALASLVTAIVEIRGGAPTAANMLFVIAGVLVVGFLVSQRIGKATLVDPRLIRHGRFLAATSAAFGTGIGVIATMSFACTFFVLGLGTSTLTAGLLLAAWSGTSALAALVFARLSAVTSGAVQLIGGLVGTAAGLALLAGMSAQSGPIHLLPGLVVAGIASGLLNTGLAREAVASVPAGNAAMGTGANNAARYIGSSIGVTIASVVAAGRDGLLGGWNEVVMLAAAASLACAVVVAVLTLIPAARAPVRGRLREVDAPPRT
jgi:Major Facilitator Superfamily